MYNWAKTQNSLHCFPHANWDAYSRKTVSSLLLSRMFCFEFCTRGHIPAKRRSLMVKQHIFLSVQSLCIHKIFFLPEESRYRSMCVASKKTTPSVTPRSAALVRTPNVLDRGAAGGDPAVDSPFWYGKLLPSGNLSHSY